MSAAEVVERLNSIFDRYEFRALRDAMEASQADSISSGTPELDELVRRSIANDVVVQFHGELALPEGDRYEGLEGYLRFFRGWLAAFDEYALEHGDYEEVGDSVVVDVVHRGRGRGSGLQVELAQVQRWVVLNGRVREIHVYPSREEALADTE